MLVRTLGATLLRNLLTVKEVKWSKIPEQEVKRAAKGTIRAGEGLNRADEETIR